MITWSEMMKCEFGKLAKARYTHHYLNVKTFFSNITFIKSVKQKGKRLHKLILQTERKEK